VVRDRGEGFERFSRAVDGPLTVLALAMIPLLVLPLVVDLSPGAEAAVLAIDRVRRPRDRELARSGFVTDRGGAILEHPTTRAAQGAS
jgi:hypothetical protein